MSKRVFELAPAPRRAAVALALVGGLLAAAPMLLVVVAGSSGVFPLAIANAIAVVVVLAAGVGFAWLVLRSLARLRVEVTGSGVGLVRNDGRTDSPLLFAPQAALAVAVVERPPCPAWVRALIRVVGAYGKALPQGTVIVTGGGPLVRVDFGEDAFWVTPAEPARFVEATERWIARNGRVPRRQASPSSNTAGSRPRTGAAQPDEEATDA